MRTYISRCNFFHSLLISVYLFISLSQFPGSSGYIYIFFNHFTPSTTIKPLRHSELKSGGEYRIKEQKERVDNDWYGI